MTVYKGLRRLHFHFLLLKKISITVSGQKVRDNSAGCNCEETMFKVNVKGYKTPRRVLKTVLKITPSLMANDCTLDPAGVRKMR